MAKRVDLASVLDPALPHLCMKRLRKAGVIPILAANLSDHLAKLNNFPVVVREEVAKTTPGNGVDMIDDAAARRVQLLATVPEKVFAFYNGDIRCQAWRIADNMGIRDEELKEEAHEQALIALREVDPNKIHYFWLFKKRLLNEVRARQNARARLNDACEWRVICDELRDHVSRLCGRLDLLDRFVEFLSLTPDVARVTILRNCGFRPAWIASVLKIRPYEVTRFFEAGQASVHDAVLAVDGLPLEMKAIMRLLVDEGRSEFETARRLGVSVRRVALLVGEIRVRLISEPFHRTGHRTGPRSD